MINEQKELEILSQALNFNTRAISKENEELDFLSLIYEVDITGIKNLQFLYDHAKKIANSYYGQGFFLFYNLANFFKHSLPVAVEDELFSSKLAWRDFGYFNEESFGYIYAKKIIKNRLRTELEKTCNCMSYVKWLERNGENIENLLMGNSELTVEYYNKYKTVPESVHNAMLALSTTNCENVKKYFKLRKRNKKYLKNMLKEFDESETVAEILNKL